MKKCNKCNQEKELTEFYRRKKYPFYINSKCKLCSKIEYSSEKHKIYLQKWRNKNREKLRAACKKSKNKNKDKIREYERNRWKNDPCFRLTHNLRKRLRTALKINLGMRIGSAIRDLGCSIEDLKKHLETQFKPGMTWENYGNKKGQWSIDHIIPLSKVDLTNREEFLKVNNYKNLRPMWHIENAKKSNKIEQLNNMKKLTTIDGALYTWL